MKTKLLKKFHKEANKEYKLYKEYTNFDDRVYYVIHYWSNTERKYCELDTLYSPLTTLGGKIYIPSHIDFMERMCEKYKDEVNLNLMRAVLEAYKQDNYNDLCGFGCMLVMENRDYMVDLLEYIRLWYIKNQVRKMIENRDNKDHEYYSERIEV